MSRAGALSHLFRWELRNSNPYVSEDIHPLLQRAQSPQ